MVGTCWLSKVELSRFNEHVVEQTPTLPQIKSMANQTKKKKISRGLENNLKRMAGYY